MTMFRLEGLVTRHGCWQCGGRSLTRNNVILFGGLSSKQNVVGTEFARECVGWAPRMKRLRPVAEWVHDIVYVEGRTWWRTAHLRSNDERG